MKTSDVLRKAGDVLRERGWHQGSWHGENGTCCAWGALCIAKNAEGQDAADEERELVELVACASRVPEGWNALPVWNDRNGRTASDVKHALDAAYVLALQCEGVEPEDVL